MPTGAMQPGPTFQTAPFGPVTKGVIDEANPTLVSSQPGAVREAEHFIMQGQGQLSIRPGLVLTCGLYNSNGGTVTPVTSVLYVGAFKDTAVVLTHSTVTDTVDLYQFTPDFQNYYVGDGTTVPVTTLGPPFVPGAMPLASIWTSIDAPPDVSVTEGLGYLYIANTVASDKNGLYWPTMYWNGAYSSVTIAELNGSGTYDSSGNFTPGTDVVYFNGVIAFQQALWGWGWNFGSTVADAFDPCMARFSQPLFAALALTDSITIGDRVNSARERIVGAGVAGQSLFLGGNQLLSRVTGYGRNSWYKTPVDRSYGFVGPKCMVTVGTYMYYWSQHGPMRIDGYNPYSLPEPLWDAVQGTVASVINPQAMVALADLDRDQVIWHYDIGAGVRTFCAYDYRRSLWVGPKADFGVVIKAAGQVQPLYASTASTPEAPIGPPTGASTTAITSTGATAGWTPGDNFSQVEISVQQPGTTAWIVVTLLVAGTASYTFTGQSTSTEYQWRVRAFFNGAYTTYLGPNTDPTDTTYTTLSGFTQLPVPNNNTPVSATVIGNSRTNPNVTVTWTNPTITASTQIDAEPPTLTSFQPWATAAPGQASASLWLPAAGGWGLSVLATESGYLPSAGTPALFVTITP